ncbi:MAG: undecaprenyl-diphosphate phosphatase [Alphaproteobacteria bacterium]|nr:undecaprenyl-diphosphate phosphatase [Alphaproteobacteria bacterium]
MTLFHIVILAIVQGITEFLPISASGHTVLASALLGWPDQGPLVDVAVHAGTLLAVAVYFWRDLWEMLAGAAGAFAGRKSPGLRLLLFLVVATIPVVVVGYFGLRYVSTALRSVEVIAWTTLLFGLLLGIADRLCMTVRRLEHMNHVGALFVGVVQVLSLIPGTSRAGVTMTACRLLGMERREAARFSILLSIPAILGAAALTGLDVYESGGLAFRANAVLAAALSFAAALAAIAFMMRWLTHATFMPFVVYRAILGAGLLYWVYS